MPESEHFNDSLFIVNGPAISCCAYDRHGEGLQWSERMRELPNPSETLCRT
jgi:hypothetical protein